MRKIVMVLSLLLTACASNMLSVTYYSDPPGAILYEDSRSFGYTPVTLNYEVSEQDRESGVKQLRGTQVVWQSGASAHINYLTADLKNIGMNQQFTFRRPSDAAGLDGDLQFAENLRRQREARSDAATAALLGLGAQLLQSSGPRALAPTPSPNRYQYDIDWAWDEFYNNGQLVWACRGKQTGEFANDYACAGKPKNDFTWPQK